MDLTIVALIALAVITILVVRAQVAKTTVFEYERGLRFVRGRLRGEMGAGLYRYLKAYTTITKVDTRPVQLAVGGQEVLSRDGVAVKISLSATYRVTDPRTAILNADDYVAALYTELQQALRAAVSAADIETLLQNRADIGPQILQACQAAAERLGLTLERLAVRDLTLPGDLKKIFAQVVKARQEGLAALERARGETAALRNLANAAQMVQRNPQLFQLRLLQVAGQQTGTTLVVGMPQGTAAIPLRDGSAEIEALPPDSQGGRLEE
jgi:regulator of protease activity HflC (stomatin/prohibitin superfamily)